MEGLEMIPVQKFMTFYRRAQSGRLLLFLLFALLVGWLLFYWLF
jgi:hypothetical protein